MVASSFMKKNRSPPEQIGWADDRATGVPRKEQVARPRARGWKKSPFSYEGRGSPTICGAQTRAREVRVVEQEVANSLRGHGSSRRRRFLA